MVRPFAAALILLIATLIPARADEAEAVRALAEQGDAEAQFALGAMHRDGQAVEQDFVQALRWLHSAADQGLLDAQFALGNIYAGGSGITKDLVQAYMWFDIAASSTADDWLSPIAGSNRDAVAARMTPAEISEAQNKVVDWRLARGQ